MRTKIQIAQSVGAAKYTDCFSADHHPTNEYPVYDTKQSDDEASSNSGALENAEYSFIAIAPCTTLSQNGST